MKSFLTPSAALAVVVGLAQAQQSIFSVDTDDDVRKSAAIIAHDMLSYYHGNESGQVPGILPGPPPAGPYYWWEGGAMWGTLVDYWYYTGDSTYNDITMQSLLFQIGENQAYMPKNYTASLGNDDQGFWGMSAMLAAENKFPDPPTDKPGWLALAQAVWNTQAAPDRHDDTCGGGLRWQIPFSNNGYDYKNSIANGIFFNMGARLARYTGNDTYAKVAEQTFNWLMDVHLIDAETYAIYDGAHVETNCTDIDKAEYSYNIAAIAQGCAFMYNYTKGSQVWEDRLNKFIVHGLAHFFPDGIAYEPNCEPFGSCTADMFTFKGYLHRWWSMMTLLAPVGDQVLPTLKKSAAAAVNQCTGGTLGRQCGFKWSSGSYDGVTGAGQQMSVLGATIGLLVGASAKPPVTATNGGTSKGNVNAGEGTNDNFQQHYGPVTTGDKAGAGIITFIVLAGVTGMFGWMSFER